MADRIWLVAVNCTTLIVDRMMGIWVAYDIQGIMMLTLF